MWELLDVECDTLEVIVSVDVQVPFGNEQYTDDPTHGEKGKEAVPCNERLTRVRMAIVF